MALDVEKFIAPGKYTIDSSMEEINIKLKVENGSYYKRRAPISSENKSKIKYNSTKNK